MPVFDDDFPVQFYPMMPGNREVTLIKKTVRAGASESDTRAAGVAVDARKVTVTGDEKIQNNIAITTPAAKFEVWTDGSRLGFVAPENEDTLIDDDGTKYTIVNANETILETLWVCICTKKWSQS